MPEHKPAPGPKPTHLQSGHVAQTRRQRLRQQAVAGRARAVRGRQPGDELQQQHAHAVRVGRLAQLACAQRLVMAVTWPRSCLYYAC